MKFKELREMSDEQLGLTLKETAEGLFRLRIQAQTERLDAPSELAKSRRMIARIKTLQHERYLKNKPTEPVAPPVKVEAPKATKAKGAAKDAKSKDAKAKDAKSKPKAESAPKKVEAKKPEAKKPEAKKPAAAAKKK
jgi:large subunit ribosomal protein L29